jgi:hypothetical protein
MRRKKKRVCLVRGCKRTNITGYGLCDSHYQATTRKVEMGRTTWAAEVAEGRATPKGYKYRNTTPATGK